MFFPNNAIHYLDNENLNFPKSRDEPRHPTEEDVSVRHQQRPRYLLRGDLHCVKCEGTNILRDPEFSSGLGNPLAKCYHKVILVS